MAQTVTAYPTSHSDRQAAFAHHLEQTLEAYPRHLVSIDLFVDVEIDRHTWIRETAEYVASTFATQVYAPDLEPMIFGLVDYAVSTTRQLTTAYPGIDRDVVQAALVEFAIQILAKTCASDGTRHAARSRGNRIRNLYLEQMRGDVR